MRDRPYYITTAIHYPNGKPHMGSALEWVQADVLARYARLYLNVPVKFQIGLDEHGLKIQRSAGDLPPQEYVDGQAAAFQKLATDLQISAERFIRTTESEHHALAQAFWRRCVAAGDIYKKTYRAWYNVKEETFLGLADEVDVDSLGVDKQFLELIEEENYFFAASKYQDQVVSILEKQEYNIVPANRRLELINFVRDKGLQDISISRSREKLAWGIPVPDDDSQVMYVWFDALTNYITGVSTLEHGEIRLNEFWPAAVHCVGKDISRFHGLLWPAMLLSAGLPLPETLLVHGFILANGRKMSKSLGNGVDPQEIIAEFGADSLRWYLVHAIPTLGDGDFTRERFEQVYASDLANDFGNLVSRVVSMAHQYCDGRVPTVTKEQVDNLEKAIVQEKWEEYHAAFARFSLNGATEAAHQLMVFSNRRIDELKPWVLAKDEYKRAELEECLYELLEIIRHIAVMLMPVLPETSERVLNQVLLEMTPQKAETWGCLVSGSQLGAVVALFPRRNP